MWKITWEKHLNVFYYLDSDFIQRFHLLYTQVKFSNIFRYKNNKIRFLMWHMWFFHINSEHTQDTVGDGYLISYCSGKSSFYYCVIWWFVISKLKKKFWKKYEQTVWNRSLKLKERGSACCRRETVGKLWQVNSVLSIFFSSFKTVDLTSSPLCAQPSRTVFEI